MKENCEKQNALHIFQRFQTNARWLLTTPLEFNQIQVIQYLLSPFSNKISLITD